MKKMNGVQALCAVTLGIAALFAAAARSPAAAQSLTQGGIDDPPQAGQGHTYWRNIETGAIIDLYPCAESRICMKTHFVDVTNTQMRKDAAAGLEKPLQATTDDDMRLYCGFGPRFLNMKEEKPNTANGATFKWKGNMKVALSLLRGQGYHEGKFLGVEIEDGINVQGEHTLRIQGWWDRPLVSGIRPARATQRFIEVTDPRQLPPACTPPPVPYSLERPPLTEIIKRYGQ